MFVQSIHAIITSHKKNEPWQAGEYADLEIAAKNGSLFLAAYKKLYTVTEHFNQSKVTNQTW